MPPLSSGMLSFLVVEKLSSLSSILIEGSERSWGAANEEVGMSDMKKTKAQLIEELDLLRHRIAEMEAAEDGLMQDDDGIRQEKETLSLINALKSARNHRTA